MNHYEFEIELEITIDIPITVKYTINPGQRGIMHPADRACENIPAYVEDVTVEIEEDFDLEEKLSKIVLEDFYDDLMEEANSR